jgi:predicted Rossmann-fold nucleotide-binding protein
MTRPPPRPATPAGRADEIMLAREVGAAIARLGFTVMTGGTEDL